MKKLKLAERKKLLTAGLALLLLLLAVKLAGTYLFDEEVSRNNSLRVALFDLKVNGKDGPGNLVNLVNILPGESYTTTIPAKLVGNRAGVLKITFSNFKFDEEGLSEAENSSESTNTAPIWEYFYVSVNGGSRSTLKEGLTKTVGLLSPNETTNVVLRFEAKSDLSNIYQGDAVFFDMTFRAEQQ